MFITLMPKTTLIYIFLKFRNEKAMSDAKSYLIVLKKKNSVFKI